MDRLKEFLILVGLSAILALLYTLAGIALGR